MWISVSCREWRDTELLEYRIYTGVLHFLEPSPLCRYLGFAARYKLSPSLLRGLVDDCFQTSDPGREDGLSETEHIFPCAFEMFRI
jgi:hypothetical protein